MTIPDEAVEAAALAFIATRSADNYVAPEEYAAAMLEAAAPFMTQQINHYHYTTTSIATPPN